MHLASPIKDLSPETTSPDPLIKRVSYRPGEVMDCTISIPDDPIKSTIFPRSVTSSSIELLDTLRIELQTMILNLLDFQSLCGSAIERRPW